MNFKEVSDVNKERALLWHPGGLEEWSVSDWSTAMAGEAGEVCNAVKKLRRLEGTLRQSNGPQTREEAIAKIAIEIGDTYLYLDLLAQRLGISIEDAIRDTFNRVSVREGFPQRLGEQRTERPSLGPDDMCECAHPLLSHGERACRAYGCTCRRFVKVAVTA